MIFMLQGYPIWPSDLGRPSETADEEKIAVFVSVSSKIYRLVESQAHIFHGWKSYVHLGLLEESRAH